LSVKLLLNRTEIRLQGVWSQLFVVLRAKEFRLALRSLRIEKEFGNYLVFIERGESQTIQRYILYIICSWWAVILRLFILKEYAVSKSYGIIKCLQFIIQINELFRLHPGNSVMNSNRRTLWNVVIEYSMG